MANFIKRLLAGFPRKLKAGRARRYVCKGGPMDGQELVLHTDSTLVFSLHGQCGRYAPPPHGGKSRLIYWEAELLDERKTK